MDFFAFSNRQACESALLDDVSARLSETLQGSNQVSIALAGGNTPKDFYSQLSEVEIPWQKVKVSLTDERWVDVEHPDSNERMIKQTLLQNEAKSCLFFGLKNSEITPMAGQLRTADLLNKAVKKIDYAILGMGDDGHFASIFPNMENTEQLLDLNQTAPCLPACPEGKPARMSLTLSYLLRAKCLYVFVCGEAKRSVIENMQQPNPETILPIYYLIHQDECPVKFYWSES
ncbi:6-phosphogluconolactonase [Oceaniserpentilla sp. 4NH20-0058]|uniref:6-phosphogluconolactonase n=1 Tax=Oceaniserpentilla sp. 4NH20-0058 TaxID=3127660 RepID=UPI003108330E